MLYEAGGRGAARFFMLPEPTNKELPACHMTGTQTFRREE
jgi:hypothetical protein